MFSILGDAVEMLLEYWVHFWNFNSVLSRKFSNSRIFLGHFSELKKQELSEVTGI